MDARSVYLGNVSMLLSSHESCHGSLTEGRWTTQRRQRRSKRISKRAERLIESLSSATNSQATRKGELFARVWISRADTHMWSSQIRRLCRMPWC